LTVSYSDLFDGEEHWLGKGCEPGWTEPDLRVGAVVEDEVQRKLTDLETKSTNIVPAPDARHAAAWGVEEGWQAFAVMMQQVGELLSPGGENHLVAEQLVVRDKAWKVTSSHYKILWKGSQDDVKGI
jgi:hypothetical protein